MTGFKDGASTDDPFSGDENQDEPTASVTESGLDEPLRSPNKETSAVSTDTGLPWIYERSSITDGREKTVQLHLQDHTVDQQRAVKTEFCIVICSLFIPCIFSGPYYLFRVSNRDIRITNTIIQLSDRRYRMNSPVLKSARGTARGVLTAEFHE